MQHMANIFKTSHRDHAVRLLVKLHLQQSTSGKLVARLTLTLSELGVELHIRTR
jgi:hypothetical protein